MQLQGPEQRKAVVTFSSQQPTQYFPALWTLAKKELPVQLQLDFSVFSSKAYSVSGVAAPSTSGVCPAFEDVAMFEACELACCSVFPSAEILICTNCVLLRIAHGERPMHCAPLVGMLTDWELSFLPRGPPSPEKQSAGDTTGAILPSPPRNLHLCCSK